MDLISRKAAIKFAKEQMVKVTGAYTKGWNAALFVMKSALNNHDAILSVPAVPLDKLCEWLERNAAGRWNGLEYTAAGWKDELTTWMEEQNADRQ